AREHKDKGLSGTTLHYPYEVRASADYFDEIPDVKVQNEMLKLAEHILATKTGDFDPTQFKDHYEEAVVELIRKKRENIPVKTEKEAPAAPNVINLKHTRRERA